MTGTPVTPTHSSFVLRPPNAQPNKKPEGQRTDKDSEQESSDVQLLYHQFQEKALSDGLDVSSTKLFPPSMPFQTQNAFSQEGIDIYGPGTEALLPRNPIFHTDLKWKVVSDFPDVFDDTSVRLKYALNTNSVVCTIQYDPTGQLVAFADGRTVFVLESQDGSLSTTIQLPQTLKQMDMHTRALRFTPDSRYIIVNCPNNSIEVFSIADGRRVAVLEGHEDIVSALAFTPDGRRLVSGGFDGMVCVWDLETFQLLKRLDHKDSGIGGKRDKDSIIVSIDSCVDGNFVAVAFMSGVIGIYEPSFSSPMNTFAAHQKSMLNMSASRKHHTLVTTSQDMTVKCWNVGAVASCSRTFRGHSNYTVTAQFCLNEKYLLSGSKDETIRLWNRETGQVQCTIYAHQNTIFELDHHPHENAFVTCGGDGYVCYWEYELQE